MGEGRRAGLAMVGLLAQVSNVNISALAAFHPEDGGNDLVLMDLQAVWRSMGKTVGETQ
jgi:hypothetical protein